MESAKIILNYNANSPNNYTAWMESLVDNLGPVYGNLAKVLKTNTKYIVPNVKDEDFMPPQEMDENGDVIPHGITVAQKADLRIAAIKDRNKKVAILKGDEPKFYDSIWSSIGQNSRQVISGHVDYAQAFADSDPHPLLSIVRKTHLTEVARGGQNATIKNNLQADKDFLAIRQLPDETLVRLKKRCEDDHDVLVGMGLPRKSEAVRAMHFMCALDERFAEYVMSVENAAVTGTPMPDTMRKVFDQASGYKTKGVKVARDGSLSTVFLACEDVKPMPDSVKARMWQQRNQSAPSQVALKQSQSTIVPQLGKQETRTCHLCKKKGHLMANCSDNPHRVLIATGEEDQQDFYADFDEAYIANFVCNTRTAVLFSPTEIVLDNAAGLDVFMNPKLLNNRESSPIVRMGGVKLDSGGLVISERGTFADLGTVGYSPSAAANILSQGRLIDMGISVDYDKHKDEYVVTGPTNIYHFKRKKLPGVHFARRHYTYETADETLDATLVATVTDNQRRYTTQEVKRAESASELMTRLGYSSNADAIAIVNQGIINCDITATDLRIAQAIEGIQKPSLRGKTKKKKSMIATGVLGPRVVQIEQALHVDIMFIRDLIFLIGVFMPLGLIMVCSLPNRAVQAVGIGLLSFLNAARSRWFDTVTIRTDGEGAIAKMASTLAEKGIVVDVAGPGQHVPVVERAIETVKERVRSHVTSLPFTLTKLLLTYLVLFCVSRLNLLPSSNSLDKVSPHEQFTGLKLDYARDLRCGYGDYVQATVPNTDNSMSPRTMGCITLLPTGNTTGSVKMWCLATQTVIVRDQFRILPMPDLVCTYISQIANLEGYSVKYFDIGVMLSPPVPVELPLLPAMMPIDDRLTQADQADTVELGVNVSAELPDNLIQPTLEVTPDLQSNNIQSEAPTVGSRTKHPPPYLRDYILIMHSESDRLGAIVRKELLARADWHDCDFAFTMSVKAAMRDRGPEAEAVIVAELQQMVEKKVWHPIHVKDLSSKERRSIIRSSMFLKDKYFASGAFEKFKARLVASGNQQNRTLYENLTSPTAATTSLLTVASIAAAENRTILIIDIGGAFLNASMLPTGVTVYMRLNALMSSILVKIDPLYDKYLEADGTIVVGLDRALYGCVEAAALWFEDIKSKLLAYGFVQNSYDACVFNRIGRDGKQTSIVLHVDDLFVTSENVDDLEDLNLFLKSMYKETKSRTGKVIDFVGMTFDFTQSGCVKVTMDNCTDDILKSCGVTEAKATPAASNLFDVRDAPKLSAADSKYFHTHVAKMLYLAKRVRPECLTAVSFLSTRVQVCDIDDMAKLRRLLGYIFGTRHRGIMLCIGEHMTVKAYIDAAYGVHQDSGKSHTGCAIVLGDGGPLLAKSSKQKIVTKSSTEAELVGLSDTATLAIHLRNFVLGQGYDIGPAIVYQDNLSCMALMKRGGPGSERSRHINIRHFWLAERVDKGEVLIEHLGTEEMFANMLTKPVQGSQFAKERMGLTNWRSE